MSQLDLNARLPAVRSELQLLPGIREINGLKSWLIFDPIRHQYFQIDDNNHALLSQWADQTVGDLIDSLKHRGVGADDVESLLRFLWSNSLTLEPPAGDISYLTQHRSSKKSHWLGRLVHGYLFFILPLLRPDRFLIKTEPFTRFIFTRSWFCFIFIISLIGFYLTSRQWDQFLHTFSHFFSAEGLLYYALALVLVKLAHEAGHAYAATRYGCTVKSMGMAFIVMLPVLYTDTTDSWKLTSRKQRLVITGAGVAVELSLAAIATLVWAFSVDGPLRSAAFFIATTSWIMTVLVNMNPLMRFDAYHFLSDLLGIQNLQSRSFAMGKWSMRKLLFGCRDTEPEAMKQSLMKGLTVFAWATWIYRFFLFLGIAILVHTMFFRPFGSILAIVEITYFIAIPIMRETREWYSRKNELTTRPNSWVTVSCLGLFLFSIFYPWQSTVRIPAVLEPAHATRIYSPADARLNKVLVAQGERVEQGQVLLSFESEQLASEMVLVKKEIDLRIARLNRIAADMTDRGLNLVLESELAGYEERLTGLHTENQRLEIKAPFTGVVASLDKNLHADRWAGEGQYLLTMTSNEGARVKGFVEHSNISRLTDGADAIFVPDLPEHAKLEGDVTFVESVNTETISIASLASSYGGPIAVSDKDSLEPLKSWYHVSVDIPEYTGSVVQQRRGLVLAQGEPESVAIRVWRRVFQVLLREVFI